MSYFQSRRVLFGKELTLSQTRPGFYMSAVYLSLLKTTWGKGEIACNEQFLLFPHCFLPPLDIFLPFLFNSKVSSANSFHLEESKICLLGKGKI